MTGRRTFLQIFLLTLAWAAVEISSAENLVKTFGNSGTPGSFNRESPRHSYDEAGHPDQTRASASRLTISQPTDEIVPLDNILAETRPHELGSLVGVRLVSRRGQQAYRLRILKDTGGVVDLYVHAKTGARM